MICFEILLTFLPKERCICVSCFVALRVIVYVLERRKVIGLPFIPIAEVWDVGYIGILWVDEGIW